jgi:hypothetical protein
MTIWYILYSFGTFFLVLVLCAKQNLATLVGEAAFVESAFDEVSKNLRQDPERNAGEDLLAFLLYACT